MTDFIPIFLKTVDAIWLPYAIFVALWYVWQTYFLYSFSESAERTSGLHRFVLPLQLAGIGVVVLSIIILTLGASNQSIDPLAISPAAVGSWLKTWGPAVLVAALMLSLLVFDRRAFFLSLAWTAVALFLPIYGPQAKDTTDSAIDSLFGSATNASCSRVAGSMARGRAIHVVDGDTFDIDAEGDPRGTDRIRLWGVDAPDRGEPGFLEASEALKQLLGSEEVECHVRYLDRTKRPRCVATCANGSVADLGEAMLRNGWVQTHPRYVSEFPELSQRYNSAETDAKGASRGIWR